MKFKCRACNENVGISYDVDQTNGNLIGRPWYVDESGLNHLAIVCLKCGTIHDASGSTSRAFLTLFKSKLKVHGVINPVQLSELVLDKVGREPALFRDTAIEYIGLPAPIIDALVERNILGKAFERKET
jgi:hypothetical protein